MAELKRNIVLRALLSLVATLTILGAGAQSSLRFTRSVWDFGTIREADGKVSYSFEYVNRGKQPVVIDQMMCRVVAPRPNSAANRSRRASAAS